MPELENQTDDKKNLNRGEKKCRKSLLKLGMKQLTGITRVTLKKRDGLIFVINDPEVLKSGTNDCSYAVFGELKLEDPNTRLASTEAGKFKEGAAAVKEGTTVSAAEAVAGDSGKKEEEKKPEDDGVPLPEDGLTVNHIDMVM